MSSPSFRRSLLPSTPDGSSQMQTQLEALDHLTGTQLELADAITIGDSKNSSEIEERVENGISKRLDELQRLALPGDSLQLQMVKKHLLSWPVQQCPIRNSVIQSVSKIFNLSYQASIASLIHAIAASLENTEIITNTQKPVATRHFNSHSIFSWVIGQKSRGKGDVITAAIILARLFCSQLPQDNREQFIFREILGEAGLKELLERKKATYENESTSKRVKKSEAYNKTAQKKNANSQPGIAGVAAMGLEIDDDYIKEYHDPIDVEDNVFEYFSAKGMAFNLTPLRNRSILMGLDEGKELWDELFDNNKSGDYNSILSSLHSISRYTKKQAGAKGFNYSIRASLSLIASVHPLYVIPVLQNRAFDPTGVLEKSLFVNVHADEELADDIIDYSSTVAAALGKSEISSSSSKGSASKDDAGSDYSDTLRTFVKDMVQINRCLYDGHSANLAFKIDGDGWDETVHTIKSFKGSEQIDNLIVKYPSMIARLSILVWVGCFASMTGFETRPAAAASKKTNKNTEAKPAFAAMDFLEIPNEFKDACPNWAREVMYRNTAGVLKLSNNHPTAEIKNSANETDNGNPNDSTEVMVKITGSTPNRLKNTLRVMSSNNFSELGFPNFKTAKSSLGLAKAEFDNVIHNMSPHEGIFKVVDSVPIFVATERQIASLIQCHSGNKSKDAPRLNQKRLSDAASKGRALIARRGEQSTSSNDDENQADLNVSTTANHAANDNGEDKEAANQNDKKISKNAEIGKVGKF